MEKQYDVAIVGGGIAGYSAALTAKSLKLDYIWLGEEGFGEKLFHAEYVRNFPAVAGNGKEFAALLKAQQEKEGVVLTPAKVDGIYPLMTLQAEGSKPQFVLSHKGETTSARAVILATGVASAGTVKGEEDFLGRGVSYCAVCDGALYQNKKIAAVVTSEKYAEEAEYLAGFASEVLAFCLYSNPVFTAKNIRIVQGMPERIEGDGRVRAVVTKNGRCEVEGVFFLRSAAPLHALVSGLKTEDGHVAVGRDCSTNIAGMFAAGDMTGRPYQYVKAAGEGCVAAYSVRAYLSGQKAES